VAFRWAIVWSRESVCTGMVEGVEEDRYSVAFP
jgi:hypothetical protein